MTEHRDPPVPSTLNQSSPTTPLRLPWVLLCVLLVLLAGVIAYIGPRKILETILIQLSEDTAYAPGYSERAFRHLAIGDTEATVTGALGTPLEESSAEPYVRWLYTPDLESVREFEETGEYPSIRFSFTTINFGEGGVFTGAFGQISSGSSSTLGAASHSVTLLGDRTNSLSLSNAEIDELRSEKTRPAQIEAKFGKPQAIFESHAVKWLRYSHSPGGTHYRQRLIGIDRNGKVCRKVDAIWWD